MTVILHCETISQYFCCLQPWTLFSWAWIFLKTWSWPESARDLILASWTCSIIKEWKLSKMHRCIWKNVFYFSGSLTKRIVFCICIIIAIFIFTAILAMVDTSDWTGGSFFAVTMVSIAILNSATGIYQNCVYGVAAAFPFSYTNAVIMGNNLSGTWTAIISIITIAGFKQ